MDSGESSSQGSSIVKISPDMERNLANLDKMAEIGKQRQNLKDKEIIAVSSLSLSNSDYDDILKKEQKAIKSFLEKHAPKGSSMRKQLEQALEESNTSSSESSREKRRSLSMTHFDELLEVIGNATEKLEQKHYKKKKKLKSLEVLLLELQQQDLVSGRPWHPFVQHWLLQ